MRVGFRSVKNKALSGCLTAYESGKVFLQYQPPPDSFIMKCLEESAIPGLEEVGKKDVHILLRIFYAISTFLCGVLGSFLIYWAADKAIQEPVSIRTDPVEIYTGQILFPGGTILPPGSFKLSSLNEMHRILDDVQDGIGPVVPGYGRWMLKDAVHLVSDVSQICEGHESFMEESEVVSKPNDSTNYKRKGYLPDLVKALDVVSRDDPADSDVKGKIVPFLKAGMHTVDEMFGKCRLGGVPFACNQLFHETFTELGGGFSFNSIPQAAIRMNHSIAQMLSHPHSEDILKKWRKLNMDKDAVQYAFAPSGLLSNKSAIPVPFYQKVPGKPSGLKFLYLFNRKEFACRQRDGNGFLFLVHNPMDYADIRRFGMELPFGYEINIVIIPIVMQADPGIRHLAPATRKCYFTDEGKQAKLEYYANYTQTICHAECIAKYVYKICECKLLSSPGAPKEVLCPPSKLGCVADAETKIYDSGLHKECGHCLNDCVSVTYKVDTDSKIPIEEDYQAVIRKGMKLENTTEMAIIHMFFGTLKEFGGRRTLTYTPSEGVGMVGGNVGITNGLHAPGVIKSTVRLFTYLVLPLSLAFMRWFIRKMKKLYVKLKSMWAAYRQRSISPLREIDLEAQVPIREIQVQSAIVPELEYSSVFEEIDLN